LALKVYEIQQGSFALASHVHRGYELLLQLDSKGNSRFRVIGVCSYLRRHMGHKEGFAAYIALKNTGLVKSVGKVTSKQGGNFSAFLIHRRPFKRLNVDYQERPPQKRRNLGKRRIAANTQRVSIVGAYQPLPKRNRRRKVESTMPKKLLVALLKNAGKDPNILPTSVEVHFIFD
jgi:hypothetical protein